MFKDQNESIYKELKKVLEQCLTKQRILIKRNDKVDTIKNSGTENYNN